MPIKQLFVFLACACVAVLQAGHASAGEQSINAHSFTLPSPDDEPIDLAQYKGKVVMVVNTASQCSFTKQYGPLQKLQEEYGDRGFVVIGVPTNEFGGQEPGSNQEIEAFTKARFGVEFPITAKTEITGRNAEPFYKWAKEQVGVIGAPRWNFHKYLIDTDGNLNTWFSTFTEPDSPELKAAIEALLPSESQVEATADSTATQDGEQG